MENRIELSILYDFYGELLKESQKQIFEDYIQNDLSLSEIAMDAGISRQGVHDIIKRCSKQLIDYEVKLKLVDKFKNTKEKVNEIIRISNLIKETKEISRIDEIEELSSSILNEL
nr:putative DNA-binding protein [Mobilisporobacter senegalensis]